MSISPYVPLLYLRPYGLGEKQLRKLFMAVNSNLVCKLIPAFKLLLSSSTYWKLYTLGSDFGWLTETRCP